jgi:hypothetical protein
MTDLPPSNGSPVIASPHADGLPSGDAPQPSDSYVKLAMRNMVRKGRTSLLHYGLTVIGLLGTLVGLAYLTH